MKKTLLFIATAVTLISCQEALEDKAEREAREETEKNCPIVYDEMQVMDSMTFDRSTHTFGYHYRLIGKADTISSINPEAFRSALTDAIKNATSFRAYKDEGYNFRYVYRSDRQRGRVYWETTIKKEDYQN